MPVDEVWMTAADRRPTREAAAPTAQRSDRLDAEVVKHAASRTVAFLPMCRGSAVTSP